MIRSEPSNNVSSNHVQETVSCFVLTSHFLDVLRSDLPYGEEE